MLTSEVSMQLPGWQGATAYACIHRKTVAQAKSHPVLGELSSFSGGTKTTNNNTLATSTMLKSQDGKLPFENTKADLRKEPVTACNCLPGCPLSVCMVLLSDNHMEKQQWWPHLHLLPHKYQAGVDEPFEQVVEDGFVHFSQGTRESVDPRFYQRAPAQRPRLHVDHAAARHLHTGDQTVNSFVGTLLSPLQYSIASICARGTMT